MLRLPDPSTATEAHGPIARNAWLGLRYVVRNPTLRGLAVTLSTLNLAWGILEIAIPVLVLYSTAVVTEDSEVRFFRDIYGHDATLAKALAKDRADLGDK